MAPNCQLPRASKCHCELHADVFKKQYLKYKSAQSKLTDVDLNKNIKEILSQFNQYAKVYRLRQQCLRKYFRMEHWDEGHKQIICTIWKSLIQLENRLTELANTKPQHMKPQIPIAQSETDELEIVETPEEAITVIRKFSAMESLSNPNSCLSKQWTTNAKQRQDIDQTLTKVLIYNNLDSPQEAIDALMPKKEHAYKIIYTLLQLLYEKSQSNDKVIKKKVDFNMHLSACCLKTILRAALTPTLKHLMRVCFCEYIIQDNISFATWICINDPRCLDTRPLVDIDGSYKRKTDCEYVVIVQEIGHQKYKEEWEFKDPKLGKFAKSEWYTAMKISRMAMITGGAVIHPEICKNWTAHQHGYVECQNCLREIKEEVAFGTYHDVPRTA